jgi:hypothetical protein
MTNDNRCDINECRITSAEAVFSTEQMTLDQNGSPKNSQRNFIILKDDE